MKGRLQIALLTVVAGVLFALPMHGQRWSGAAGGDSWVPDAYNLIFGLPAGTDGVFVRTTASNEITLTGANGQKYIINLGTTGVTFPNGMTFAASDTGAWDGLTLVKSTTVGPTVGEEGVALYVQNNRTAVIEDQAVITAVEGVSRARGAGRELTLRGGHFRTYIDETYTGADAITSVGVDGAVRASGAVVAHDGTAFVGVRSYMAPGFTAGSLANVTNHHAFWGFNEHATNAVTNGLYLSDGGGGFTNGLNFSGATITNDITFSNGMILKKADVNAWDGLKLTKSLTSGPTVGNESVALFVENNRTDTIEDQATVTGIESAVRARGAGRSLTIRGGHFRTYIDADTYPGADAITSVGVDGAVRTTASLAAHDGTAFVGVRSYMAPDFADASKVTNFHAFWGYNESASQAVTNLLYGSDGGGGFTYGVNLSGTTIGTADIVLSNGLTLASATPKELDIFNSAQTTAAGSTTFYSKVESLTNALTGDQIAVRGRSNNNVASMTGAIIGGYFQAANYQDSANGTLRGAYIEALTKGKDAAVARGLEVNVDTDDTEVFGTELSALYASVQTGSNQTYSGVATVLRLANNGVAGGGGKNLGSFIRMDSESNAVGATVLVDASAAKQVAQTGNAVCLMSFKDSAGTTRYLIYDADAATAVSVNTTCP